MTGVEVLVTLIPTVTHICVMNHRDCCDDGAGYYTPYGQSNNRSGVGGSWGSCDTAGGIDDGS